MTEIFRERIRITPQILIWMVGLILVVVIGGFLIMDLSGLSAADQFVLVRWSFPGLRIYLWLEGAVLSASVIALGARIISTGFAVARGTTSQMFGIPLRMQSRLPRQFGYVFVFLGSSLVALSLTTLVLLNSCRYMRLI